MGNVRRSVWRMAFKGLRGSSWFWVIIPYCLYFCKIHRVHIKWKIQTSRLSRLFPRLHPKVLFSSLDRYCSLSESESTSRVYRKWQSAFRGMLKLCAKEAARKRACERLLSRTSLAKTSNATTLNRKCNGCHFSKLSSQCCGIIFLLNNSKVVMIKISFTLISWLLIVTNR